MTDLVDARRVQAAVLAGNMAIDTATVDALTEFGNLFLRWNTRINLGGRIGPGELIDRHLLDAVVASRYVAEGATVVDVGSGGGLPVLPLTLLCPTARFDLFEPIGKKVAFLRTAVRELELQDRVRVVQAHLDFKGAGGIGRTFDVAMSRATFAPAAWLVLGQQLINESGRVLVFATGVDPPGCPPPSEFVQYAHDRAILLYASAVSDVPRGTQAGQ